MKHKITLLLLLLVFGVGLAATAQEKKVLSLNEAIELSIKNSHQLKNNQAKVEEATAALKEATQKRLPNATVSGSYLRLNTATWI